MGRTVEICKCHFFTRRYCSLALQYACTFPFRASIRASDRSRLFLFTFFLTGIGANLIAVNFYSSSLGASGAIFGVIGALIILRPLEVVWAFGMPMPLFVAGIIWIGADIIGTFIPSNVGTIAHLSGVGIGILLGIFYRLMKPSGSLPKGNKISFSEDLMRDWEDAYLR